MDKPTKDGITLRHLKIKGRKTDRCTSTNYHEEHRYRCVLNRLHIDDSPIHKFLNGNGELIHSWQ